MHACTIGDKANSSGVVYGCACPCGTCPSACFQIWLSGGGDLSSLTAEKLLSIIFGYKVKYIITLLYYNTNKWQTVYDQILNVEYNFDEVKNMHRFEFTTEGVDLYVEIVL